MAEIWGAVAAAVVGAGAALYGSNKQAHDQRAANAANSTSVSNQNNSAWANYLLTRGIAPTSPVESGVMPAPGQYNVVNTRLPLWANMNMPSAAQQPDRSNVPLFVKRGQ